MVDLVTRTRLRAIAELAASGQAPRAEWADWAQAAEGLEDELLRIVGSAVADALDLAAPLPATSHTLTQPR